MKNDPYFQQIKNFYGIRKAKRSGVPYMNHIYEGLIILDRIGASLAAKQAFCMHPILQCDVDFAENALYVNGSPYILILATEYRSVANEYLSKRVIKSISEIRLSPIKDVNDMMIADKVQNYKDFCQYHLGEHERSPELVQYFRNWLEVFNITPEKWETLISDLDEERKKLENV